MDGTFPICGGTREGIEKDFGFIGGTGPVIERDNGFIDWSLIGGFGDGAGEFIWQADIWRD